MNNCRALSDYLLYFQAILDFVLSSNWTKVALIYDVFTHDTVMLEVR